MRRAFWSAALCLPLLACQNPVDKAAKARIFSAEDPPRFVTRATDDLGASDLPADAEHLRRVFTMSALEAGERLGPHQVQSTLTFHWKLGKKVLALDEKHTVTVGSHGDFSARLDAGDSLGDSKQGMEMVRAQGRVYARSRFQKFRERTRDRGAANRYEEQVYDVLGTVYRLFDGRIALSPDGEDTVAGRKVIRYKVALAATSPGLEPETANLPALVPPRGGIDSQLAHEVQLDQKKQPQSLSGTLEVDAETAVALRANLRGALQAPGEPEKASSLELTVDLAVARVGSDVVVALPADARPDEGRIDSIATALERFDLPRASDRADAGAPGDDDDDDGQ